MCPPACLPVRHQTPCRSALAQINPLDGTQVADLLPFWVVGNDGGFYPELQEPITALEMGPAERYDIVIDFTGEQ